MLSLRHLKRHLKTQSGEKSNKCNKCVYASSYKSHLRQHMKTHRGEKKNECDYESSYKSHLMQHMKTHSGEKSNNCNKCDYASFIKVIWGNIWKFTVEKSKTIATNATMRPLIKVIWGNILKRKVEKSKQMRLCVIL